MKGRNQKMRWVGLTGGIASGKSTVSKLFQSRGIPVIDADEVAHQVVKKGSVGLQKIVQAFGPEILNKDQELDRQKMAQLVFGKTENLEKLEGIVHPLVQEEVRRRRSDLEQQGSNIVIYDVPLLFEKKLAAQFDGILVIGCDPELQKQRLISRNKITLEEALKRIRSQESPELKKQNATWYIDNSGSLEDLKEKFSVVLQKIQSGKL
jgi:dephospho-CoA kinase